MRYCDGLPETGERPLRAEERAAVARLRRTLGRRVVARLALGLASPLVAAALVAVLLGVHAALAALGHEPVGRVRDALTAASAVTAFAGLVVGPAAALLSARDRWRDWWRVRRDHAAAVALEFGDGARAVAVLPASGRVLARDGRPSDLSGQVPVGLGAAPAPAAVPTYALQVDGDAREIAAHGLVRRALTGDERDELRRHARALRRFPRGLWLATGWWAFVAALAVHAWSRGAAPNRAAVAVLTLLLALGLWRLRRARSLAARLEADAEEGWVIRATTGPTSGVEGLPASRAVWTSDGAPAPWRTRDGA